MQTITTFKRRITIQTVLAFLLVIFGMTVVMLALYMPPMGEIHPSVITVFGMLLVASGAFIGIDLNFQIKPFIEAIRDRERRNTVQTHETI
ncbi:MAG: hypothetical protein UH625_09335 [Muribaculaceae bacterium]|nr:hypothetical protein [Muribaculaceae bacterium]